MLFLPCHECSLEGDMGKKEGAKDIETFVKWCVLVEKRRLFRKIKEKSDRACTSSLGSWK